MAENSDNYNLKEITLFKNNIFNIIEHINNLCDFLFLDKSIDSFSLFRGVFLCGSEAPSSFSPLGIEKYNKLFDANFDTYLSNEKEIVKTNNKDLEISEDEEKQENEGKGKNRELLFFKDFYNKK